MGESASLARSCVLSYANDPFLRVIDHSHELTEDVFVRVVDFLEFRVPDIAMAKCKLDVHLRFSASPSDRRRHVSSLFRPFADSPIRSSSSSILWCFQLGEFFLRAIHIVLSCDSQFKKLLLTP